MWHLFRPRARRDAAATASAMPSCPLVERRCGRLAPTPSPCLFTPPRIRRPPDDPIESGPIPVTPISGGRPFYLFISIIPSTTNNAQPSSGLVEPGTPAVLYKHAALRTCDATPASGGGSTVATVVGAPLFTSTAAARGAPHASACPLASSGAHGHGARRHLRARSSCGQRPLIGCCMLAPSPSVLDG